MHAPTRTAALQQAQEGWLTGPGALSGVALFPSRKGRLVLIWGLSATSVGLTTAVYVCDRCGTNAAHRRLTKRVRRFTLFFVPLFSVSTTYVDNCTACGRDVEVANAQAKAAVAQRLAGQQPP